MMSLVLNRSEPKIILLDIETLPDLMEALKIWPGLSAYPGLTLKADISSIISFAWKEVGDPTIHSICAWDYPSWTVNVNDDLLLVRKISEILADADAVVHHNGRSFDMRHIQTRIAIHNKSLEHEDKIPFVRDIPQVDTKLLAKKNLMMFNNKLSTVAKLTSEEKMDNGGWDLWVDVWHRSIEAQGLMRLYNEQDVKTLDAVFQVLKPFAKNIPNYNLWPGAVGNVCPYCSSTRFVKDGVKGTKTTIKQRYRCKDCFGNFSMNKYDALPRSV